jgi:hypothetical protein
VARHIIGIEFIGQAAGLDGLAQRIQEALDPFVRIELRMGTEPAALIEEGEEESALALAGGKFEGRPVHAIGHPQQVGQGMSESLGGPAHEAGTGSEAAAIQAELDEAAMDRAIAEGAGLEHASTNQFLDKGLKSEGGVKAAELEQGFESLRIEGALLAAIPAGLVVEAGEATVAVAVEPPFQSRERVKPAVPGLLGGAVKGLGESQSALASLLDRLDGGEASQGLTLARIVVRGS